MRRREPGPEEGTPFASANRERQKKKEKQKKKKKTHKQISAIWGCSNPSVPDTSTQNACASLEML